jgi:prolyl-tRNA editing enzyme YbaK/EbsC (Cys-tRNA(Pro) deacylase)
MSANKKILVHLGKKNVAFEIVKHKKVYTAYDLAQTLGTELDKIAKTLLVRVELPGLKKEGVRHYAVVVPASYYIDLGKIKKQLKALKVEMAPERVMKKLGIEPGAVSPFGSLRGLGVAVDKALLKTKDAVVGAESFTESLRLAAKDILKAEEAIVGDFGKKSGLKLQKRAKPAKKSKRPAKKAKPVRGGKKKPAKGPTKKVVKKAKPAPRRKIAAKKPARR